MSCDRIADVTHLPLNVDQNSIIIRKCILETSMSFSAKKNELVIPVVPQTLQFIHSFKNNFHSPIRSTKFFFILKWFAAFGKIRSVRQPAIPPIVPPSGGGPTPSGPTSMPSCPPSSSASTTGLLSRKPLNPPRSAHSLPQAP